MSRVSYVEIDLPICQLSYAQGACNAKLGETGEIKCFNTLATCQDVENFDPSSQTVRFSTSSLDNNPDIDAIPSIVDVDYTPPKVNLGEGIGARSVLTVTFRDHPSPDTGVGGDPYLKERDYNPYERGSYWGKFVARFKFLRGRKLRWYVGDTSQRLENMELREFVLDRIEGPDTRGRVRIISKDPLTLLDDKRARAPRVSSGVLAGDVEDDATTLLINPAGIVAEQYDIPTPYFIAVAGEEVMRVTSVDTQSDELTVERGQFNTEAIEHDAEERIQVCLNYEGEPPQDIIYNLMTQFGNISEDLIRKDNWDAEVNDFLGTVDIPAVYTGIITEPEGVVDLVNEISEQAGISLFWDDVGQTIELQVLRFLPITTRPYDDNVILAGTFSQREQPDKRVSQAWVYYSQLDPLESREDPTNYREAVVQQSPQSFERYGTESVRQIFSRWIPKGGFEVARKVTQLLLARFGEPPRRFKFDLLRESGVDEPSLGDACNVRSFAIQDETGAPLDIRCQLTSIVANEGTFRCEAEEITRSDFESIERDANVIQIPLPTRANDINLRSVFNGIRNINDIQEGDEIRFEIRSGSVIGSTSTSRAALRTGNWSDLPTDASISLTIFEGGYIVGRGGRGGDAFATALRVDDIEEGGDGGPALEVVQEIEITNNGIIGGGGGAGGGAGDAGEVNGGGTFASAAAAAGGSGGAGRIGGSAGNGESASDGNDESDSGNQGGLELGGSGVFVSAFHVDPGNPNNTVLVEATGGAGGALGEPGSAGVSFRRRRGSISDDRNRQFDGGQPGSAVIGNNLITWIEQGDIRGAIED